MLYFLTGVGSVSFHILISAESGTAGSSGAGLLAFSFYLEEALFQTKFQPSYAFYQNTHQSHLIQYLKAGVVLLYFYILNIVYSNALFLPLVYSYFVQSLNQIYFEPNSSPKDEELLNEDLQLNLRKKKYVLALIVMLVIV